MEDLRESVSEMDEMEQIRIETELEKQHQAGGAPREREQHRDSGVGGDMAGAGRGALVAVARLRADTRHKLTPTSRGLPSTTASWT